MHPPADFSYFQRSLNLDIGNKCRLQCPCCDRTLDPSMISRAKDISIEDFAKILDVWSDLHFCGQISDPIYHPKFLEMLAMCKDCHHVSISTNGTGKRDSWWDQAFETSLDNGNVFWRFALDGLPNESHIYRINQDGEQVWSVMKKGASLGLPIEWQYIPFRYNEDHIDQAKQMAADHGITLRLKISNRHPEGQRPTNPKLRVDYVQLTEA